MEINGTCHDLFGGVADADSDAVARDDLDSEAAHPAAQLCEHFVPGVTLHAVEPTGVNRYHGSLHINQIVFAQRGSF